MRARQKNRLLRNVCRACIPSLVARKRPAPRTLRLACGMVNVRFRCNLYCPCSSKGLMSRKTARKDARQMCRQKDFSLVGTLSKTHACTQQGHVSQNHEKQVNNHIYSLFILSHGAESKRRYLKKKAYAFVTVINPGPTFVIRTTSWVCGEGHRRLLFIRQMQLHTFDKQRMWLRRNLVNLA